MCKGCFGSWAGWYVPGSGEAQRWGEEWRVFQLRSLSLFSCTFKCLACLICCVLEGFDPPINVAMQTVLERAFLCNPPFGICWIKI